MPDVLIRGLSQAAVDQIDQQAKRMGLSRNEYLRREYESDVPATPPQAMTAGDWQRTAQLFADLDRPEVMDAAWQ